MKNAALLVCWVMLLALLQVRPAVSDNATWEICYDQGTGVVFGFKPVGYDSWSDYEKGIAQTPSGRWFAVAELTFTGQDPTWPLYDNTEQGVWIVSPLPDVPGTEPYPSTTAKKCKFNKKYTPTPTPTVTDTPTPTPTP